MRRFFLALVLLSAPASAAAQDAHDHGTTVAGRIPRDIIERPVPIRQGIGKVSHPTSTTSKEAQAFYEQGLAYLHSYVWLEAARSFNQAIRLDGDFALAWVGLSRAYTGLEDAEMARDAQKHAEAIKDVTPREARWRDVRAKQIDAMAAAQEKADDAHFAYIKAIDAALEGDPADAELWTLRGNAEEPGGAFGRGQRGTASSIAFYERAIALAPGHFGAHHYLIHSYEQIGHFDKALEHGKVYADAASEVPHALHMYAHDLMKLGRTGEAIEVFGRARTLEHAYYEREDIARDFDWHHAHNLALLALSHRHEGQLDEAEALLREGASVGQSSPVRKGYYQGVLLDLLYARGRHDEVVREARELSAWTQLPVKALGHALAARSLMAQGRQADAAPHIDALAKGGSEAGMYGIYADLQAGLALGEHELRSGKRAAGAQRLRAVMARARGQRSPDGWIEGLFTLEAVFEIARATGEWALAADAAARLMEHDKAYAGSQEAARAIAARSAESRRP
jgi:tetratricopeptide (TPR) repeat protein